MLSCAERPDRAGGADAPITFRPVTDGDLGLLAAWMDEPHWRTWWGDPATELGFIRDMVAGRDTTRPYLFACGERPIGYIQVWFIGDHQTPAWIASTPWLADLPADAVGVDLSIGPGDCLGRGFGSHALRAFVAMLVAEGHRRIIIDPDPANARAIAAYTKAGFRPLPHLIGRTEDVLLMHFPDTWTGMPAAGAGPVASFVGTTP